MVSLFFREFAFQRVSLQRYRNNSVARQEMGSFHSDTEVTTIDTSVMSVEILSVREYGYK